MAERGQGFDAYNPRLSQSMQSDPGCSKTEELPRESDCREQVHGHPIDPKWGSTLYKQFADSFVLLMHMFV